MNDYYVYQYLREDGTPYYIGKGKGNRLFSKKHTVNLPTDLTRIKKISENLTNDEARELEIKLIAKYGRKDLGTGILHNKTSGGEGINEPSDAIRKRMSDANKGKVLSEQTRAKISLARLGKSLSEETKQKMRKPKSDEHKKKISETQQKRKRNPLSEETKAKISLARKGKPGYPRTEETRQKMRGPRGPQKNPKRNTLQIISNTI